MKKIILATLLLATLQAQTQSPPDTIPHLEKRDNRYALIVDGKPFLLLGAQINNSSSWPATLPAAWSSLEALHVNTVEAPVYWEQIEPTQNKFDFANVDLIVTQARDHHLRVVLLWFGTWKNGQNHYVPEWIKSDPKQYPREENPDGKLLDVMSPNSSTNLEADKHAFAALMQHLKTIDATQHTVLMIQVENESGSVGSIRDFSSAAQKLFDAQVPADLTRTLHLPAGGTWTHTFGPNADESFAAYSTARYINEVAAAGKAEYPLPMYCNVWFAYPVHALENRDRPTAGQEYPSGGPQQANIPIWKAAAPAIDILAPDFYSDDRSLFREIVATYARPGNPLFIPETRADVHFGPNLFYALGHGAIGFSPFGIDRAGRPGSATTIAAPTPQTAPTNPAENYELLNPIAQQIAELNLAGKLQTAVEDKGSPRQTLHFADPGGIAADAIVSLGFPQPDGAYPPGTPDLHGRALIAQLGPLDFLVTGFDASVTFRLAGTTHNQQLEILHAEEGRYVDGVWQTIRILNGDQTDRGLNFHTGVQPLVRIHLHTLPLYDEAIHHPQP
jgi:Domain of unknown function (DUF5597)/Glycosyl hydrolases family 35